MGLCGRVTTARGLYSIGRVSRRLPGLVPAGAGCQSTNERERKPADDAAGHSSRMRRRGRWKWAFETV